MRTFGKKQQRVLAAVLMGGLLSMPCDLLAQNANKQVWWLKTDKGQYIEMSRVKKLDNVNQSVFEVITHQGQGASGVSKVFFEKNNFVVVKGDADGDGIVGKDDANVIVDYILGSKSDNFNFDRADINGDGKVDVADLVAAVNIIKTPKVGVRGFSVPLSQPKATSDNEPIPGTIPGTIEPQYEVWPIEPLPGSLNAPPNRVVPQPQVVIPEPITIEPEPERIVQMPEPAVDLGSVPYFRVQFTEKLLDVKKYAADGFTFFNPDYDFLDFKYSLPLTDSNLSGDPGSSHDYYIGYSPKDRTRFAIAKTDGSLAIKRITAYSQPVKYITVSSNRLSEESTGKRAITYTFNALPRNIEELKTLEVNDREYFSSPHFVTALFICCLNRLPENSADAWNMINYLRTHTATVGENNILKVSYGEMQDIVQQLLDKDTNGYPVSNGLGSYFAGSSPDNKYKPTTPYQVTVVEQSDMYTTEDGILCAKLYVKSSGDDNLVGPLKLRKVDGHGWLVYFGEKGFTKKMKPQK